LDPQGKAVLHAINHLDYEGIQDVRIGKYVEISFDNKINQNNKKIAAEICQKLLANPVIENFDIDFEEIS
jgi:phosphoribosylformylglycinamidine synthase